MTSILEGIRTIDDLRLESRRVLIRIEGTAPAPSDGGNEAADESAANEAIAPSLPTIEKALSAGARVIVAAHRASPPRREPSNASLGRPPSLEPLASHLSERFGQDVFLPDDCIGDAAKKVIADLRSGQLVLLENLLFHPQEMQNDDAFARELAANCDVYVNDALATSARARASVVSLPRLVRDKGMGYALRDELTALARICDAPERPLVAVLGGDDGGPKLELMATLLKRCDAVCVGGVLGNTLLSAAGHDLRASRIDEEQRALARSLLVQARDRSIRIVLPTDVVVAPSSDASEGRACLVRAVPDRHHALDIGPATLDSFSVTVRNAKTVLWSGALGYVANDAFLAGSLAMARALAESSAFGLVVGRGAARAVTQAGPEIAGKIGFISRGGGAALELIEGLKSPGVEALRGS